MTDQDREILDNGEWLSNKINVNATNKLLQSEDPKCHSGVQTFVQANMYPQTQWIIITMVSSPRVDEVFDCMPSY